MSDIAKVGLIASMSSLVSRKEVDPVFLFEENETNYPLIDNLLVSITCEFAQLRMQSIRLLRFGVSPDLVSSETIRRESQQISTTKSSYH